ncbi:Spy/CpxP family protein refolding chaperone [bacterium]|nr:Spy/CpxP family protein refolding chaperone [bacterium]
MNKIKLSKMAASALFTALLFTISSDAFAQPRQGFRGRGGGLHQGSLGNIERFSEELGLSDEQVASIKEARFATQKQGIELRSKIKIAQLELKELMQQESVDENEVKRQVEKVGDLRTNQMQNRVQSQLKVRAILTAEQRSKLQTLRKERMQKRFEQNAPPGRGQGPQRFRRQRGGAGPSADYEG